MSISSHGFTLLYLIFLIIGTIERVKYTFTSPKLNKIGHIYYHWTFIVLLIIYVLIVLFSIIEYFIIVKAVNPYVSITGLFIFLSGVCLRRKAGADLGYNWSFHIEIKEKQELIAGGIYRYLKHPYYLGVMLELVGVCMIANAFYSLSLVFFVQLPLLAIRTFLEEKTLVNYFGDRYEKYRFGKLF